MKLRAKLGITAADLLPAPAALDTQKFSTLIGGEDVDGCDASPAMGHRYEVDIRCWKKEAEEMLILLGASTESAHEYPMAELRRTVRTGNYLV